MRAAIFAARTAVAWAALLGSVVPLTGAATQEARPTPGAQITGTIFDSLAMRPLARALVQLAEVPATGKVGMLRTVSTDSLGAFRFGDVAAGTYLLGYQHVALDSLGLRAPLHRIDVRRAGEVKLPLAVSSMATIVKERCGASAAKDSIALLVGSIRRAANDAPVGFGFVTLRWGEMIVARNGAITRDAPTVDSRAAEDGWYAACVPGGTPVTARATLDTDVSGDLEITLSTMTILRRDLYIGPAVQYIAAEGDTARRSGVVAEGDRVVSRGRGVVRGTVHATNGKPLANARIALASGAGAIEARSDSSGRFLLSALPHGTYTLEARALGYLPDQQVVDIVEFREPRTEFLLIDLRAALLDTVRVHAAQQLEIAARAGFERRRRSGVGHFIDDAAIDSMRPNSFRDILRGMPGVRFSSGRNLDDMFEEWVEFGSSRGAACYPSLFLDGALLVTGRVNFDQIINVAIIRRVEVYGSGITPPAEFAGNSNCGVIAVWTGRRRPTVGPGTTPNPLTRSPQE